MNWHILRMEISLEHDVVLARQRARQIAGLLAFDAQDQTRIATAVSEIARNAFQYAGGGKVEFAIEKHPSASLSICIEDQGPGIPERHLAAILRGEYQSPSGMGVGITGVRRLMDVFQIDSSTSNGCTVKLGKYLPKNSSALTAQDLSNLGQQLILRTPQSPLDEVRQQNQELLRTLDEVRSGQRELAMANARLHDREQSLTQLNRELEDTNRGVVALYAELDEKADFLRRASEMKSRFLSNMSHEFRTPLNAISGLTWLLLEHSDGSLTPEQQKQVTLIRKAASDLTELVNDLLDLAKVEAGKVTMHATEFTVDTLFGALRGMLRPLLAHNSSVELIFEEALDLPVLCTDESKVSQILRNFISNALKFTERGEVRVSSKARDADLIVFSVSDTGIGIALEDQPRVFEEFVQVDGPRQKHVKGTGLGLPLVKKLAGLLGGHVELESQPGAGSAFCVVLPRVYQGHPEESIVPALSTRPDPKRRPVLVVEDNAETLFIYERYLRGSGFQVIPARTLQAARQALGQFRPVAVILDVLLEGENTWGLLQELKGAASTRDIPVLVVTLVENEAKARIMGADAFCVKPVDRSWLLDRLTLIPARADHAKVLVIEDDEASRYVMRGLLSGMNFDVIEARDGDEGLRLARDLRPRLVTLDLDLPDARGLDVMKQLRHEAETRSIPIIINSSRVLSEHDRYDMLLAGASSVLSKASLSGAEGEAELRSALEAVGLLSRAGKSHA
jgi:signal transduction histidine kinase/DNA-binding response OmpR family regulator